MPLSDEQLYGLILEGAMVALAVVAILTTLKQVVRAWLGARALDSRAWQVALKLAPLVLGALLGLVTGLFDEYATGARALLGAVSGFASPTIYGLFKQRLAGVLVSGHAPDRAGKGPAGHGDADAVRD